MFGPEAETEPREQSARRTTAVYNTQAAKVVITPLVAHTETLIRRRTACPFLEARAADSPALSLSQEQFEQPPPSLDCGFMWSKCPRIGVDVQ